MTKREKAERLLDIGEFEETTRKEVFDFIFARLSAAAARRSHPNEEDPEIPEVAGSVNEEELWGMVSPKVREYAIDLYCEAFSEKELDELLRIYTSPVLALLEEREPEITRKVLARGEELVGELDLRGLFRSNSRAN